MSMKILFYDVMVSERSGCLNANLPLLLKEGLCVCMHFYRPIQASLHLCFDTRSNSVGGKTSWSLSAVPGICFCNPFLYHCTSLHCYLAQNLD